MQATTLGPVTEQERITTIDIIRGFALLGITIVNFTVDNDRVTPVDGWSGLFDQLAYWPISFFLDDKFMSIFCFLFGLGFSIQMLRAESKHSPFVLIYIRRLFVLYLISIFQDIFIGPSILEGYAVVGVLLLIIHKLNYKFLPMLALLCFLIPTTQNIIKSKNDSQLISKKVAVVIDNNILDTYTGVYERVTNRWTIITREGNKLFFEQQRGKFPLHTKSKTDFEVGSSNDILTFSKDSTGVISSIVVKTASGSIITLRKTQLEIKKAQKLITEQRNKNQSYKNVVLNKINNIWDGYKSWSWKHEFFRADRIAGILPLFLIGLYAGRRKIFNDINGNRKFLKTMMWRCFIIGITGVSISVGFEAWNYINDIELQSYSSLTRNLIGICWDFCAMILALSYVAGLSLLLENNNWKKRLSFLLPIGRMALTVYVLQAIARTLIFDSFWMGLSGKIGSFYRLLLALSVILILIIVSRLWFKYFRFGPLEWLWRSLTYLKFQPMKLKASDENNKQERR